MTYLSWAAVHEGSTDEAYFNVLIPLLMEDILQSHGSRNSTVPQNPAVKLGKRGRSIESIAAEVCHESAAFYILFLHADVGGRALGTTINDRTSAYIEAISNLCGFSVTRCVIIAPRHETEAWLLADSQAIGEALGFRGELKSLGLPVDAVNAEKLTDPKQVLQQAVREIRGNRRPIEIARVIPAIAARQRLDCLRSASSFRDFEIGLKGALFDLGCIKQA